MSATAAAVPASASALRVGVGVGVLAVRHGSPPSVLVSLRKSRHGRGEWALPGGHLELGESLVECARRELAEETGIEAGRGEGRLVATENCVFRADGGSDAGGAWPWAGGGEGKREGPPGDEIRAHYVALFVRFDEPSVGAWPAPLDREPEKHSPFEFASWEELVASAAAAAAAAAPSSEASSPSAKYAPLFGPLRMLVEKHGSLDQLR